MPLGIADTPSEVSCGYKIVRSAKTPAPAHAVLLERFAVRVSELRASLSQPDVRTEAAQVLPELLEPVTILSDAPGGPQAEIAASPARLIAYAQDARNPRRRAGGGEKRTVMVVAGTRNHLNLLLNVKC